MHLVVKELNKFSVAYSDFIVKYIIECEFTQEMEISESVCKRIYSINHMHTLDNETFLRNTIKISTYTMPKTYNSFSFHDTILSLNESIFIKPFLI